MMDKQCCHCYTCSHSHYCTSVGDWSVCIEVTQLDDLAGCWSTSLHSLHSFQLSPTQVPVAMDTNNMVPTNTRAGDMYCRLV